MSKSSQSSELPEFQLRIRDRLGFPYLLEKQIQTFQQAILNKEFSRRDVEESIQGLVNMIPSRWQDERYKQDVEAAKTKKTIDVRPTFAGIPRSIEKCKAQEIPINKKLDVIDYFKLLHAVVDQLERLGMLSRREFTEAVTGMPVDETALPPGMNRQEYLASLDLDKQDDSPDSVS